MSDQIRNVFISHVHEDDSKLADFKSLLGNHNCTIRDASIDSSNPNDASNKDYIKSEILAPGIKWAGTLVVLISPNTHKSEWVNWEIEYAEKQGKRIVGVWCQGAKDSDLPEALEKHYDALVGWNGEKIIDAIDGNLDGGEKPDGSPNPVRPITRVVCQ